MVDELLPLKLKLLNVQIQTITINEFYTNPYIYIYNIIDTLGVKKHF